jgi:Arm DNA-binding domain
VYRKPENLLISLLVPTPKRRGGTNTMALTDTAIRTTKPRAKPFKLTDGGGLHLLVNPSAVKLWRLAYRFGGKQKTLALGAYPIITLDAA